MPERLRVTPVEAAVIFINALFWYGQHGTEVAQAFRSKNFAYQVSPEVDPRMLIPETFMQAPRRSVLLLNTVDQALEMLTPRQRMAIRWRFGFEDGKIHTLKEVGDALEAPKYAEGAKRLILASFKTLRHPARRQRLQESLSE